MSRAKIERKRKDFLPLDPRVAEVSYQAEIVWKNSIPHLVSAPAKISLSPREALVSLLEKCLDLPYDGRDPQLAGMTQGEAMIINLTRSAANGDHEARMAILDRLLGRPKQSIESVQLSGDLNSFLDRVAAESKIETIEVTPEPPMDPNSTEDL